MEDDKKAKLLLVSDKVIDIDQLPIATVSSLSYDVKESLMFEPEEVFMTPQEKRENQVMRVEMNISFYGKLKDLSSLYNAKKLKVVPLDESGNIID